MLVPGFVIRELPVELTSINNVEYAADGRLFAAGYDGRYHLLRDSNGDGLEDKVDTFWSQTSANYPLGMTVKEGTPYVVLADEVIRFVDTDGDGVPDRRETVIKGFDDPALAKLPYLHHRRVDSSMAIALGPDDAIYVTMGNAGFSNPYWHDAMQPSAAIGRTFTGTPRYSTDKRRGCLLRIAPDGKVEQLASGLRYIMSLQWNRAGDLFGTDQEGATWSPNGNPFDELLHLQRGRHYGFPPRHPQFLPDVVDEPSVWDFGPQHQSVCGFRFNGPMPGRGRFGPGFWADNAILTGESRGKLWRTVLAATGAGYVARTELIASLGLLAVDCAISPEGDVVIACHTGAPDWGNGPTGRGRLLKISYVDKTRPQPVITWAASETETVIAFDRPVEVEEWARVAKKVRIDSGKYVAAADRLEAMRPGYAVVKHQQSEPRGVAMAKDVRLSSDRRSVIVETAPRVAAVSYAMAVPGQLDVAHGLTGLSAVWRGENGGSWAGWLPHADFAAARIFTEASAQHEELWRSLQSRGRLTLTTQLDLWQMLIPATQPGSKLDYEPEAETVTLTFASDAVLDVTIRGSETERISATESRITVHGPREANWLSLTLTLATPARRLDVAFSTTRDPRPRALGIRRFLLPFARPGAPDLAPLQIPEIAGGNWAAGRALFLGKATCHTCHEIRGEGVRVGPDLSNLVHRDYASVWQDIVDPNATINPDAVGYVVTRKDGSTIAGTRLGENAFELRLAQPGGTVVKLAKSEIVKTEPMPVSLMPAGLDTALSAEEARDLMTFLLRPAAK